MTGGGWSHPEAAVAVVPEAAQLVHERGGDLGAPALAEGRAAVRLEGLEEPLVLLPPTTSRVSSSRSSRGHSK